MGTATRDRGILSTIFASPQNSRNLAETPQKGGSEFTVSKPGVYPIETPGLPYWNFRFHPGKLRERRGVIFAVNKFHKEYPNWHIWSKSK